MTLPCLTDSDGIYLIIAQFIKKSLQAGQKTLSRIISDKQRETWRQQRDGGVQDEILFSA